MFVWGTRYTKVGGLILHVCLGDTGYTKVGGLILHVCMGDTVLGIPGIQGKLRI
jgi:hypothetical protein